MLFGSVQTALFYGECGLKMQFKEIVGMLCPPMADGVFPHWKSFASKGLLMNTIKMANSATDEISISEFTCSKALHTVGE